MICGVDELRDATNEYRGSGAAERTEYHKVLPFVLAPVLAYLVFDDVRSGSYFETDHALPEIFIPLGLALIGSARVGYRAAIDRSGLQAWSWAMCVAALSVTALVVATIAKMLSQSGGDSQLDSPATIAGLAVAGAYAIVTIFDASARISAPGDGRPALQLASQLLSRCLFLSEGAIRC